MRSRLFGRTLVVSLGLHAVGIATAVHLSQYLTPYRPLPYSHVPILHLRLPDSILYFRPAQRPASQSSLPPLPIPKTRSAQTIVQPNTVRRPEVAIAVPNLLLWSAPVEPTPRQFVAPGRAGPLTKTRMTLAPPDLTLAPAQHAALTGAVPALASPKLPSGGRPLITAEPAIIASQVSLGPLATSGDPLMLIALNPANLPPRSLQEVPLLSQQASSGAGLGAGGDGAAASVVSPPLAANPALNAALKPIEMIHPDNRVFDAVVIRSEPADERDRGLLTSQPIYSAYLDVGAPHHWLLEYCAAGAAVKRSGSIITLPNPMRLQAPYPRHTIVPALSQMRSASSTVIRGVLNSVGHFEGLEVVRGVGALAQLLLPYLAQWEFRPASQGGRATNVEIVLSIPALN